MRIVSVLLDHLEHGPNPRSDPGDVRPLARRILASGWVDPLIVVEGEDGGYLVYDGHRRLEALRLARELRRTGEVEASPSSPSRDSVLVEIPCQVIEASDGNDQARFLAIVAHAERLELPFLDRAEWYRDLFDKDYAYSEIAELTGDSYGTIRIAVRLARGLSPDVKQALREGNKIQRSLLVEWITLPKQTQKERLEAWQQRRGPRKNRPPAVKTAARRPRKAKVELTAERLRANGHPVAAQALEWAIGNTKMIPKAAQK